MRNHVVNLVARVRARLATLRGAAERGSVSSFAVVAVVGLFLAIGLVVDGGRKIQAVERAQALAENAARVGANELDFPELYLSGGRPQVDATKAHAAATAALQAGGADMGGSSVTVTGNRVHVTASVTQPTTFLATIGIGSVTGVGEAEVEPFPGITTELP